MADEILFFFIIFQTYENIKPFFVRKSYKKQAVGRIWIIGHSLPNPYFNRDLTFLL